MKFKFAVFLSCVSMILAVCGTLGGAVSGAGEDLQKVGGWIKSK
jgi:predicted small secreted protein